MVYNRNTIYQREGKVLNKNEFQALFEMLLSDSVKRGAIENRTVNRKRYEVLNKAYDELSALIGDGSEPKLKLHPAVSSGSVSVKVQSAELNGEQLQKLKEILNECDTFSVDPLTDGNLSIAVTVQKVFQSN